MFAKIIFYRISLKLSTIFFLILIPKFLYNLAKFSAYIF